MRKMVNDVSLVCLPWLNFAIDSPVIARIAAFTLQSPIFLDIHHAEGPLLASH